MNRTIVRRIAWGMLACCSGLGLQAQTTPTFTISAASLTFSFQIGATSFPAAQTLQIKNAAGVMSYALTITGVNTGWLSTSLRPGVLGSTPGTVAVTVTPTGLGAGSYAATLTITDNANAANKIDVPVTLNVLAPAPTLRFSPATLTAFNYTTGGTLPASQQFIIYTDGNPISATITVAGAPWLKVNPTGSIRLSGLYTPVTLSIDSVELAKLVPKAYTATLTVAAPTATNKTTAYPVTLNVNAALPTISSIWPSSLFINPATAKSPVVVNVLGANYFDTSVVSVANYTPTAKIVLTDSAATPNQATEVVAIPVYPATASNFRLSFGSPLPNGLVGSPYNVDLTSAIKSAPTVVNYAWGATGLPAGITLNSATGILSGTPTTPGTSDVNITLTEMISAKAVSRTAKLKVYSGGVPAGVLVTVPTLIPEATTASTFTASLAAVGGTAPYSWAVDSTTTLPAGLVIGSSGTPVSITGKPTQPGALVTKRLNDGTLQATVGSGYLAGAGLMKLTVSTPAPGGGTSAEADLPVAGPEPQVFSVVNAASFKGGAISPGEMLTIFGAGMGPTTLTVFDPNLPSLPQSLPTGPGISSTSVDITAGGVTYQAALIYTSHSQISLIVPFEVAGSPSATLVVRYGTLSSQPFSLPAIRATNPALYSLDGSGSGQGAILNFNATTSDYTINSDKNQAIKGSTVVLYLTGFGITTPVSNSWQRVVAANVKQAGALTVTIGGVNAPADAAVPVGSVPGLLQVNVTIPDDAPAGKTVPVVVTVGGVATTSNITMGVK